MYDFFCDIVCILLLSIFIFVIILFFVIFHLEVDTFIFAVLFILIGIWLFLLDYLGTDLLEVSEFVAVLTFQYIITFYIPEVFWFVPILLQVVQVPLYWDFMWRNFSSSLQIFVHVRTNIWWYFLREIVMDTFNI